MLSLPMVIVGIGLIMWGLNKGLPIENKPSKTKTANKKNRKSAAK